MANPKQLHQTNLNQNLKMVALKTSYRVVRYWQKMHFLIDYCHGVNYSDRVAVSRLRAHVKVLLCFYLELLNSLILLLGICYSEKQ